MNLNFLYRFMFEAGDSGEGGGASDDQKELDPNDPNLTDEQKAELEAKKAAEGEGGDDTQEGDDLENTGDDILVEEDDPMEFINQVEQHTGLKVTVDYGDVDPLTPEGAAKRELAVWQNAQDAFEESLKGRDPRGYAYLLHRDNGGTDEEFFAKKAFELPDEAEFKKSTDMQSSWVKRSFIAAGIDEDVADAQVAKLIKDNKLEEKAMKVYNGEKEHHATYLKELEEENKRAIQQEQEAINGVKNKLSVAITNDLGFVIPETEKAAFHQFMVDNIRVDGKDFYVTAKIGDNLKELVNALYFQYKKGDLKALIERQAKTKAVQRYRTAAQAAKDKAAKTSEEVNKNKAFISLGEL